jgi:hypothetical protein
LPTCFRDGVDWSSAAEVEAMWSWKWCVVTLGPPVLLVVGIAAFAIADHALYSPRPFDAERWRAGDPRQRMRMAGDLHRVLKGKTWAEVVTLLGPPDRESPGLQLEFKLVRGNVLGWGEWHEWLLVRFDRETSRVREVTFFD